MVSSSSISSPRSKLSIGICWIRSLHVGMSTGTPISSRSLWSFADEVSCSNVLCASLPDLSHLHAKVYEYSKKISEHLLPRMTAYHEIWLDKKMVAGDALKDFEPLYGEFYLPRKVHATALCLDVEAEYLVRSTKLLSLFHLTTMWTYSPTMSV